MIGRRFNLKQRCLDYGALMKMQWDKASLDPVYQKMHSALLPDFETVVKNGGASFPVTPEEVPVSLMEYAPGTFPTETGKINFYSPSWPAGTVHPTRLTMPAMSPFQMEGNPYRHQRAAGNGGCAPPPEDIIRCSSLPPMRPTGPIQIMATHIY